MSQKCNEPEQSGTDGEASDLDQDQGQASSDMATNSSTTQDKINQKILEQLSATGSRLEKLENQTCKKTVDKTKIKSSTASRGNQTKKTASTSNQSTHLNVQGLSISSHYWI